MILTRNTDLVTLRFASSSDTNRGSIFDRYYNFDTIWVLGIWILCVDTMHAPITSPDLGFYLPNTYKETHVNCRSSRAKRW